MNVDLGIKLFQRKFWNYFCLRRLILKYADLDCFIRALKESISSFKWSTLSLVDFHRHSALRQILLWERMSSFTHGHALFWETARCLIGAMLFKIVRQWLLKERTDKSASFPIKREWGSNYSTNLSINLWLMERCRVRILQGGGKIGKATLKRIQQWSLTKLSFTHSWSMLRPKEKTRSKVWPPTCVGPETCWTKLKESVKAISSVAIVQVELSTCMLKFPTISTDSSLIIEDKNSANSSKNRPTGPGGLYIKTQYKGRILDICSSNDLKESWYWPVDLQGKQSR